MTANPEMLVHVNKHLLGLAASLTPTASSMSHGTTLWQYTLTPKEVLTLTKAYEALLAPELDQQVLKFLQAQGIPFHALGVASPGLPVITRSDATELLAAATLIATEQWDIDLIHMPNAPKQSRRKSESGLDVVELRLAPSGASHLAPTDRLSIASVKHTIQSDTASCVWQLQKSIDEDVSLPYLLTQLRMLHGQLIKSGHGRPSVDRVFLFLDEFQKPSDASLCSLGGVAVVDANQLSSTIERIRAKEIEFKGWQYVAVIGIPNIALLHEACA